MLIALGLCLVVAFQKNHAPQKADLHLRGKLGDSYTYSLSASEQSIHEKGALYWNTTFSQSLTKLDGTNTYWKTAFGESKSKSFGALSGLDKKFKRLDDVVVTVVKTDRANIVKVMSGVNEAPVGNFGDVAFPNHEVKVGDSWNVDTGSSTHPTMTYKMVGLTQYQGIEIAVIEGSMPKSPYAFQMKPTLFFVDASTGVMLLALGEMGSYDENNLVSAKFEIKLTDTNTKDRALLAAIKNSRSLIK